jgi:4-hydroxythreonine-4-phosphate dehydrogenase
MGDAAGIGPEIILKCLPQYENQPIVVIGARGIFEKTKKRLKLDCDFGPFLLDRIPDFDFEFGNAGKKTGEAAYQSLTIAIALLKKGEISGLVTAPLSKAALWEAQRSVALTGQTEILARAFKVKNFAMLGYSEKIKIVLATTHKPVARVRRFITAQNVFDKIILLDDFLKRSLKIKTPKIAVLAFNPHGFEFSEGEEEKIQAAVERAELRGVNTNGPFSADSIGELVKKFHGFVAMFHDQGMLPVKLLSQGRGVNVTLGLPFVRTSPLHGTAFDIAGKGVASPHSMEVAIACALKWAKPGVGET